MMGCCVFALMMTGAPRVAFLIWWFLQPARFDLTFTSIWWPILGVLVAPWTALMYVIVAPGGLTLVNWAFLGLAVAMDIGSYGGGVRARSNR